MKKNVHVYVMSAFTRNHTGGNYAGVIFDREDLREWEKKEIARQLGYSETAFVTAGTQADWHLEYFTPTDEVDLCGHATIASFTCMKLLGKLKQAACTMETKAGILRMRVEDDGLVYMEQNTPSFYDVLNVEALEAVLDVTALDPALPVQIVSTGLKDILVPIRSIEALEALKPDFEAMKELSREKDVIGMHAFVRRDDHRTAVCRNFAPLYGIEEESATGTSNCALSCYLHHYGIRSEDYLYEQGYNLHQVSEIRVHLEAEEETITAVYAGGYGDLKEELNLTVECAED